MTDPTPNPYRSPEAEPPSPPPATSQPRFRWRIIPALLLGLHGLNSLLGTCAFFAVPHSGVADGRNPAGQMAAAGVGLLILASSVTSLAAAVVWWRGQWQWAILWTALAVVASVAMSGLTGIMHG